MTSRLLLVQQHCPLVIDNMNACKALWLFLQNFKYTYSLMEISEQLPKINALF